MSNEEIPSTEASGLSLPRNSAYKAVRTSCTILFWYAVSNCIILTTKWLFTNHFPYPLSVTSYSNGVAFLWAALASCFFEREPLTSKLFFGYVLPIGLTTALEIGFSNVALKILTVSFGTILKGGGPIFTFVWGLAFGLEQFSLQIGVSLVLIAVGIALASLGEGQEFELLGFCLQLSSSALGGLRWAMTHKLLKEGNTGEGEAPKPMSALTATLYTSPMTSLCVMPFALALESKAIWNSEHLMDPVTSNATALVNSTLVNSTSTQQLSSMAAGSSGETTIILGTMTFIATLVFILLMSEYWLVKATSALALSVAGVFKELLTIGGGIFLFSEHIDALNVVGFAMCQCGILSYVCLRTPGAVGAGEYAPITVEEAAREAMEAQREMLSESPPERYIDEEGEDSGAAGVERFTISDEDDELL